MVNNWDSVFGGRLLRRYVLLREMVLGFVVSHWTPMRGVYLKYPQRLQSAVRFYHPIKYSKMLIHTQLPTFSD